MALVYNPVFKRLFDISFSVLVLVVLSPLMFIIGVLIVLDSKGGVFYRQSRVGYNNNKFKIFKFRTMHTNADKLGLLTIGGKDPRVTRMGYYLRKYKLDELPQFINVLLGEMALIGPRPEVPKYVALYNSEQLKVLNVKPGITDYASVEFADESNILSKFADPEEAYITHIMPAKLKLNLQYINDMSLSTDLGIIFMTVKKILF